MRIMMLVAAMSGTVLAATAAASAEVSTLQPSSQWHVYYRDDRCLLSRDYGTGAAAVTLAFRPFLLMTKLEVRLVTGTTSKKANSGDGTLTYLPDGRPRHGTAIAEPASATTRRFTDLTLPDPALDRLAHAVALEIAVPGERPLRVAISDADQALAALKECGADLMKRNGIDPAEQARIVTEPKQLPGAELSAFSYPSEALKRMLEGEVMIRYAVDLTGKAEECRIVASSSPLFNAPSCADIAKRQRFDGPARDKNGAPIRWYQAQIIKWRMPPMSPEFLAQVEQIEKASRGNALQLTTRPTLTLQQ